jgi:hypothetical protein
MRKQVHYYNEPKELLKAMRKEHPNVSKKDIIIAAFAVMIEVSEKDPATAKLCQDFALNNRGEI